MTDPSDWKCNQGRGDCHEPAEMPFASLTDSLIDLAMSVCGWVLVLVLIALIVSVVVGWK